MKKFAILCGIALSLGFTACDDELPNPEAQTNPELPTFVSTNLVLAQNGYGVDAPIDLQNLADQGLRATLADITTLVDFPETFDLGFTVDVAVSSDFSKFVTIDATVDEASVVTPASTINSAIYDNFTKDPSQITIYTRIAAYATQGTSTMRLGGENYYYGEYTYNVVPFNPETVIEQSYYLIGSFCNWQLSGAIAFNKTSDASAYDNPVFSVKIDVTDAQAAAGYQWKVIPGSSYGNGNTDGAMGVSVDPDNNMQGTLVEAAGTEAAGVITSSSPYTITINVKEMTYTVALAYDYLWVPGQATSQSDFSRVMRLGTTDYITYSGAVRLRNAWWLTAQASNDGIVFKKGGEETVDEESGVTTGTLVRTSDNPDAENMSATNGFYYVVANLARMSYTTSAINDIEVIGAFNGWDTAAALELSHTSNFQTWTISGVNLDANSEFKFCVNHAWTLSFGGSYDNLVQNGGNLVAPETGTYDITLDFSTLPYTCKLTKK